MFDFSLHAKYLANLTAASFFFVLALTQYATDPTHEVDLAKFYADRIIEIVDGKIDKDYENKNNNDLDYKIDNKFLLDFFY